MSPLRLLIGLTLALAPVLGQAQTRADSVGWFGRTDVRLFRAVNNHQRPALTRFVAPITVYSVYPAVLAPVGLLIYGAAKDDGHATDLGLLTGATELLTVGVTGAVKLTVRRPRPYQTLPDVHLPSGPATSFSFPSGHASTTFALATAITLDHPRPLQSTLLYGWAALTGLGRLYVGVHYPSDVLAGAALGIGSAALVHGLRGPLLRYRDRHTKPGSFLRPESPAPVELMPVQITGQRWTARVSPTPTGLAFSLGW